MSAALLKFGLAVWILATLTPSAARAQKSDLDNDLKNFPKDPGSEKQPAPPAKSPGDSAAGPQHIQPPGIYTQRFTGVAFPKRVGDFVRVAVDLYDAEARDVGASYDKKRGGNLVCIITAFSYPIPPQFASRGAPAVFEDAKLAITSRQKDARLLREGPYRAPDGSIGDLAEYEFSIGKGAAGRVYSRLYLFESKGWLLKFRVTYPAARAREGAAEAESFLRTFGTGVLRNQVNT